jgi:hypothetical protein
VKDDWDSVSSPAEDTESAWNAVSTPAPEKKRRAPIEAPLLKKTMLFLGVFLLLALSGGGAFWAVSNHAINFPNSSSAATTQAKIYNDATSGTPVFADSLDDNRNNWDQESNSGGNSCQITEGAYEAYVAELNAFVGCGGSQAIGKLNNNFALQVEIRVISGDYGGIVVGFPQSGDLEIFTGTGGDYILSRMGQDGKYHTFQSGSSAVIKSGFNQNNVFTIIANNGSLYLYVNSQFLTSAAVNYNGKGSFDFFAYSKNSATDVAFSNLKIWTL